MVLLTPPAARPATLATSLQLTAAYTVKLTVTGTVQGTAEVPGLSSKKLPESPHCQAEEWGRQGGG